MARRITAPAGVSFLAIAVHLPRYLGNAMMASIPLRPVYNINYYHTIWAATMG